MFASCMSHAHVCHVCMPHHAPCVSASARMTVQFVRITNRVVFHLGYTVKVFIFDWYSIRLFDRDFGSRKAKQVEYTFVIVQFAEISRGRIRIISTSLSQKPSSVEYDYQHGTSDTIIDINANNTLVSSRSDFQAAEGSGTALFSRRICVWIQQRIDKNHACFQLQLFALACVRSVFKTGSSGYCKWVLSQQANKHAFVGYVL